MCVNCYGKMKATRCSIEESGDLGMFVYGD